ncbi:MAG: GTPase ObgE [Bacteriovoracaceae bacterium]|nr:GTPase ObgE [Bacteriovoracaceae bacterium]
MRFIDEVNIEVISGAGGNGASSFRREKFVPFGGPDGGNGGMGGDVIFEGDENFNTLIHIRGRKTYQAPDGGKGLGSQCDGAWGEPLILKVPVGTLVINKETDEIIHDITAHGQKVTVAKGGRGGLGNAQFKSATNQAPSYSQQGTPGEKFQLKLELKLLADIALIGYPNAGKSTLISCISAAKPKIADYPFTTLEPHLGVVAIGDKSIVVADVPGLIENAAEGKGLGIKFLKHIERTKALVHLIDCSMFIEDYEAIEAYATIRQELEKFSPEFLEKKELVCLTKIDAMTEEEIDRFKKVLEEHLDKKILPISGISGRNIDVLKPLMLKMVQSEN